MKLKYISYILSKDEVRERLMINSSTPVSLCSKKMPSDQYMNSNYKDKTVTWPFQLYNGNSHTGKTASLY